jgi:hypothetical protein
MDKLRIQEHGDLDCAFTRYKLLIPGRNSSNRSHEGAASRTMSLSSGNSMSLLVHGAEEANAYVMVMVLALFGFVK